MVVQLCPDVLHEGGGGGDGSGGGGDGGTAGVAAYPVAEHVYLVFEFKVYETTVKQLYVTPFDNEDTSMADVEA